MPDKPLALPDGACDTHAHVFGPYDRFPFPGEPSYQPPLASYAMHQEMLMRAGLARGVLVQPSAYASDHSALCDALVRSEGRLRGIGVVDAHVTDETLRTLDAAGVRGLRFTEVRDAKTGARYRGAVGIEALPELLSRMTSLRWHADVWGPIEDCCRIGEQFGGRALEVVFDHMACVSIARGLADPAFQRLLALLREGRIWIKLSLCRVSRQVPGYDDAKPFHDALIEANPKRLLWGSDWPFIRLGDLAPTVEQLLGRFHAWVKDEQTRKQILVANGQALYGF
jgi:predicted TIM-barrel fold metal-dependent hydrolase